jgi:hypothetical protein
MKFVYSMIIFIFINTHFSFAQDNVDIEAKLTNFNQEKIESIELIKKNLIQAKNKLNAKATLIDGEKDPKKKILLEAEVKKLEERYNKLKLNLISVITNIKMDEIQKDESNKKRDYLQEAQELLGPAFDTIQRISERPRKIEALRKELHIYQEKLAVTQLALKNIDVVKSSTEFTSLLPDIEEFLGDATYNVNDLSQEFTLKIDRINRELNELTKDDQSLLGAATELSKEFFSNKGKHLGIAFLLFVFTIWSLTVLKNIVILRVLQKGTVEWIYKPIHALYGLITFVFALTISIMSLYVMGDWVLVTIIVLMMSAILWGSKSYIHKYLAEGRLILNLGTIKEGELVIFRGIPWKVKNINFVTIFENEYLDSSIIRIEIAQIFHMHSRKILPNEQWFPTRTNDWVTLSDGTYGQIQSQTVEQITIEIDGSERRYFTTQDYLNLRPTNLSHGFSLNLIWNLDYSIQDQLLNTIIPNLRSKFKNELEKNNIDVKNFSLDFHSAGAHSLNLFLNVKFHGHQAQNKLKFERLLNEIMLKIASTEKLNIPFEQIVVHQSQLLT